MSNQFITSLGTRQSAQNRIYNCVVGNDVEKGFDSKDRKELADEGEAEGNGSFPIRNAKDLRNAIHDYGRAGAKESDKNWIKKRAKELGLEDSLPDSWTDNDKRDDVQKALEDRRLFIENGVNNGNTFKPMDNDNIQKSIQNDLLNAKIDRMNAVKGCINKGETDQINAIPDNLEVYTERSIKEYENELNKSFASDEISFDEFEKGMKDLFNLEKKIVIDHNGKKMTVYVRHHKETGKQHEFKKGTQVTFEHKGEKKTGVIHSLSHNEKTGKYGNAEIHDEHGNVYSKSLPNIEHQKWGDKNPNGNTTSEGSTVISKPAKGKVVGKVDNSTVEGNTVTSEPVRYSGSAIGRTVKYNSDSLKDFPYEVGKEYKVKRLGSHNTLRLITDGGLQSVNISRLEYADNSTKEGNSANKKVDDGKHVVTTVPGEDENDYEYENTSFEKPEENYGFKIGLTNSDKPVYSAKPAKLYTDFDKEDHASAANLHSQEERAATYDKSYKKASHHYEMEKQHAKLSRGVYEKKYKQKDVKLKKGEDDDLEKAEGSRGGKVIGHTKSGKPVYDHFSHEGHKNFTSEDHSNAASLNHNKRAAADEKAIKISRGKANGDYIETRKKQEHHKEQAKLHNEKGIEMRKNNDLNKSNKDTEQLEEKLHMDLDNDGEKGESKEHKEKVLGKNIKKSLAERVIDDMLEKGEISSSLSCYYGNDKNLMTFEKTGKEIKQNVPTIITMLQAKLLEVSLQMAAFRDQAEAIPDQPATSSILKYLDGVNTYSWEMINQYDKDNCPTGQVSCNIDNPMRKYNNLSYCAIGITEDIATLSTLAANLEDKKEYQLSVNQLISLGFY